MSIITKAEILKFISSNRQIQDILISFRSESKLNKVTIFLSHKHGENDELVGAISFLKKFGIEIYVDWEDEGMPKTTSGKTAERLKQKIKESDKFIFLATEGAIKSTWCNWELGHGDAAKYIKNIAILPLKLTYDEYSGSEYLQIYPYIYESDKDKGSFYIKYPNNTVMSVQNWLKS